jgi:hypothetical protein
MLHGMSPNGIGLANTAVLMSLIQGLIFKGLIDQADARLWLSNAAAMIEEAKEPSNHALAIIEKEWWRFSPENQPSQRMPADGGYELRRNVSPVDTIPQRFAIVQQRS